MITTNLTMKSITIVEILEKEYPDAKTALKHSSPLDLLIATILSAQCTDERVNQVTKELFREFQTAEDYAYANPESIIKIIRSTGFFNQKAKSIQGTAKKIFEDYHGQVPDTMEGLISLPGVARKTANVVLSQYFNKIEGIVVDTHVHRVSNRLGLSDKKQADKVEQDLMKILPKDQWKSYGDTVILHGRRICNARKPKCEECSLRKLCDEYNAKSL